ncbi:hypothetical protein ACFSJS_16905 [Streptomyces desertarenae]|uniref:Asp23/Gls24 family envelope stress response protein n=1 Tax=Streptomyces desertarenae TaxID=2666184 RepID=A0ABW4PMX6_9ACTN
MPAADRGATRIADRVLTKIAIRAAREALGAVPDAPGEPHGRRAAVPRAMIAARHPSDRGGGSGDGRVWVAVELPYPCDIGAQCDAVRARVSARLRELAALEVRQVTVEVTRLHTVRSSPFGTRRGRTR